MSSLVITNLTGIAFEQISGDYYWGCYGEFKVVINKSNGYINATHLCGLAKNKNGTTKEFRFWRRCDGAKELLEAASAAVQKHTSELLVVVNGGHIMEVRGTYVHSKLIPHIASWASATFAMKVSDIVNAHYEREYLETIRIKDNNIDLLRKEVAEQKAQISEQSARIDELLNYAREQREIALQTKSELDNVSVELETVSSDLETISLEAKDTNDRLNVVQTKLNIAPPRRVPPEARAAKIEVFELYRNSAGVYKAIRCQLRSKNASVAQCIRQGYSICAYTKIGPNAASIFNRVKEQLPPSVAQIAGGFFITLVAGATEADLLAFIARIDSQRLTL